MWWPIYMWAAGCRLCVGGCGEGLNSLVIEWVVVRCLSDLESNLQSRISNLESAGIDNGPRVRSLQAAYALFRNASLDIIGQFHGAGFHPMKLFCSPTPTIV